MRPRGLPASWRRVSRTYAPAVTAPSRARERAWALAAEVVADDGSDENTGEPQEPRETLPGARGAAPWRP